MPGGGREGTRRQRRHARSEPDSRLGGQGHARRAHEEHVAHGRDAGGVKAQRLVEGRRVLPTRREGMRCGGGEVRAGRREGLWCGGGTTSGTYGNGPTQGLGAKGTRGAHLEHPAHVRDAGGVPAQRLVEGRRGLPSRREGMRCGGERWEPGAIGGRACGVVAARQAARTGMARLKAWGPRARAERT